MPRKMHQLFYILLHERNQHTKIKLPAKPNEYYKNVENIRIKGNGTVQCLVKSTAVSLEES